MQRRGLSGRRAHKGCQGRRGAVIVEFAFVSVLLLFLFFGVMEMGFMLSNALTVSSAAQQGARAAALSGNTKDASRSIATAVYNAAQTLKEPKDFNVTPVDQVPTDDSTMGIFTQSRGPNDAGWAAWDPDAGSPSGGQNAQVRVTVRYRYQPLMGNFILTSGGKMLQSSVVMRYGY